MTFAIDFDGVIHDWEHPIEGRRMGPPFKGAKEALDQLYHADHKIIIHSCNRPAIIRKWMEFYNLPFAYIWGESPSDLGQKPIADFYIDDRAVRFNGDWAATMQEVGL